MYYNAGGLELRVNSCCQGTCCSSHSGLSAILRHKKEVQKNYSHIAVFPHLTPDFLEPGSRNCWKRRELTLYVCACEYCRPSPNGNTTRQGVKFPLQNVILWCEGKLCPSCLPSLERSLLVFFRPTAFAFGRSRAPLAITARRERARPWHQGAKTIH